MTTTTPVALTTIASQANQSATVSGDWASADADSLAVFEAWLADRAITRGHFDALVAAEGVGDWRDLPVASASGYRLYAESECGGGSEAIYWWELRSGDIVGRDTGGYYWHIPAGALMPIITDYMPREAELHGEPFHVS